MISYDLSHISVDENVDINKLVLNILFAVQTKQVGKETKRQGEGNVRIRRGAADKLRKEDYWIITLIVNFKQGY